MIYCLVGRIPGSIKSLSYTMENFINETQRSSFPVQDSELEYDCNRIMLCLGKWARSVKIIR